MQVYHHVLNKLLDINDNEIASFFRMVGYRVYDNFTGLCVDFHHELDHIHDFSDYRVQTKMCPEIWHYEQTQIVHQLDVNQNERIHI